MVLNLYEAATNWFLTWDEQSTNECESFLLQVKLRNLHSPELFTDTVNSYVTICRQRNGPMSGWEVVGRTSLIKEDASPQFAEGFRVFYQQHANLASDLFKLICYHKRDSIGNEQVIGTAVVSMRDLLHALGATVELNLIKGSKEKVVGSAYLLVEPLPSCSPRGGANSFQFHISVMMPVQIKLASLKFYVLLSRERNDGTWSAIYRSELVKKRSVVNMVRGCVPITLKPFQVRQSEMVLGATPKRRIKFEFVTLGRATVAEVVTNVHQLLNQFEQDAALELRSGEQVVGEFVKVKREMGRICELHIAVNWFDMDVEARETPQRSIRKVLHLDSP